MALGNPHTVTEILMRQKNAVDHMTGISDKLRSEMPKEQYRALLDVVGGAGDGLRLDRLLDEMLTDSKAVAMVAAMAPDLNRNKNFEAAIFSRLQVLSGDKHNFDLIKVHRTRDGKFYVFAVVADKWVVLEDDELFPSDKLISALRCLTM